MKNYDPKEFERLKALIDLKILDTDEEEIYDDIVLIASNIMDTPASLITFVDEHRQWFKAKIGATIKETPREYAFCAHTIKTPDKTFIINDATKDARFATNPLVLGDPKIRFYFGAPLVTSDNQAVGTICVLDNVPRPNPTEKQIASMKALSKLVITQLEIRKSALEIRLEIDQLQSSKEKFDAEIINAYNILNEKCDLLLNKIKARRNK